MDKKLIKLHKENLFGEKAGMSYLQILTLILSTFAFCYIVYESTGILRSVSAQTEVKQSDITNCCTDSCMDIPLAAGDTLSSSACTKKCSGACEPEKCSDMTECQPGCCYDEKSGTCADGVPVKKCSGDGVTWNQDCNMKECTRGCCEIGDNMFFVTEKECELKQNLLGVGKFDSSITIDLQCLALAGQQKMGACIDKSGKETTCKFEIKGECITQTGDAFNFYEGKLCTHPQLKNMGVTCEKTNRTICKNDKVYFVDSCGNVANIYWKGGAGDSAYWSNVISDTNACDTGMNLENANSCGNCNAVTSMCGKYRAGIDTKPDDGNYVCRDLNCNKAPVLVDAFGKILATQDKLNGEQWCIYESSVGNDVPGSAHYLYSCVNGVVNKDLCDEQRKQICVQSNATVDDKTVTYASCRPNLEYQCLSYNSDAKLTAEEKQTKCEENSDCQYKHFDFGKKYVFDVCVPKYPLGFDTSTEAGQREAQTVCGIANFQCTYVKKKTFGGSKKYGENCLSESFTQQMNDFCKSLGDCGGGVSLTGDASEEGYTITNAPKIDIAQMYTQFIEPVLGKYAETGDFTDELAAKYGWNFTGGGNMGKGGVPVELWAVPGALGGVGYATLAALHATGLTVGGGALGIFGGAATSQFAYVAGNFGIVLLGAAIGSALGVLFAQWFGLGKQAAQAMALGGAVWGTGVMIILLQEFGIFTALGPLGLILAWIGLLYTVFTAIFGIGKVKKKTATFSCNPWIPPEVADAVCQKCNNNPLADCTEYKCHSLGKNCDYQTENGKGVCYALDRSDISPPVITPWNDILTNGYSYTNRTTNGFAIGKQGGGCLTPYDKVLFGIQTSKPAQCKIATAHTESYDTMGDTYFGDSSVFSLNHTMAMNIPSKEALVEYIKDTFNDDTTGMTDDEILSEGMDQLTPDELAQVNSVLVQQLGDMRFYVRCIDRLGNKNTAEYVIKTCGDSGPDYTEPVIVKTTPEDGGYVQYGATEVNFTAWANKPADCKYDSSDTEFENMANSMNCVTSLDEQDLYGFPCNANLTGLAAGVNKIYIRCNSTAGVVMENSKEITLTSTNTPLKIESIKTSCENCKNEEGNMLFGTVPATVNLEAATSGGVENGKADCKYSFTTIDRAADFKNTYSTKHTQTFNQLTDGTYNISVECEDAIGNSDNGTTGFIVKTDTAPPIVTRAYVDKKVLNIFTDETGDCSFTTNQTLGCLFDVTNETTKKMSGTATEKHTTNVELGKIYYIKCRDIWNNTAGDCSITIKPSESF